MEGEKAFLSGGKRKKEREREEKVLAKIWTNCNTFMLLVGM